VNNQQERVPWLPLVDVNLRPVDLDDQVQEQMNEHSMIFWRPSIAFYKRLWRPMNAKLQEKASIR
jgi:hypothetical protein